MSGTNIVIFAPIGEKLMTKIGICTQYCVEVGYEVVAIVRGHWEEAMDIVASGEAEVILAAEDDDLPADRTPRVEVVAHMQAAPPAPDIVRIKPSRLDRTRVLRRGAAG